MLPSNVLRRYVQGAGGLNHYSLCIPLCASSLDACLHKHKLKQMKLLLISLLHSLNVDMADFLDYLYILSLMMSESHTIMNKLLSRLLHTYVHPLSGADEVSVMAASHCHA